VVIFTSGIVGIYDDCGVYMGKDPAGISQRLKEEMSSIMKPLLLAGGGGGGTLAGNSGE
jgi:hypothetical protein